jgi:transcription elongation factor Elf1
MVELFGLQIVDRGSGETYRVDYFSCPTCEGDVCWDCVEEKGFLIKNYSCKKCGDNLERIETNPKN